MNIIKNMLNLEHESEAIERVGSIITELLEYGVQFKITKSSDILISYGGKYISMKKLVKSIEEELNEE